MDMDRRAALAGGLVALGAAVPAAAAGSDGSPVPVPAGALRPGLEFLYEMTAELGDPIAIGTSPDGTRRIIPIVSGRIEGPRISARLIEGGADFQLTRRDDVTVADATYAMRTDDGVVIQIHNKGLRHGPADVMAALASGKDVTPDRYYFRTVPEFIAPVGRYEWLNRSIFVASGARYTNSIKIWVWQLL